jgi:hypothetical protein
MYTMVLMMAMSSSGDAAAFGRSKGCGGGCAGTPVVVVESAGCHGGAGCLGGGCHGGGRKLFGGGGLFRKHKGCHGGAGCHGGGCTGVPAPAPVCCDPCATTPVVADCPPAAHAVPAPAATGSAPAAMPPATPAPVAAPEEKKEEKPN